MIGLRCCYHYQNSPNEPKCEYFVKIISQKLSKITKIWFDEFTTFLIPLVSIYWIWMLPVVDVYIFILRFNNIDWTSNHIWASTSCQTVLIFHICSPHRLIFHILYFIFYILCFISYILTFVFYIWYSSHWLVLTEWWYIEFPARATALIPPSIHSANFLILKWKMSKSSNDIYVFVPDTPTTPNKFLYILSLISTFPFASLSNIWITFSYSIWASRITRTSTAWLC